jgi:hypothetical protein
MSLEYSECTDEPIDAQAEVFVINTVLFGIHRDERIADDIFKKGTDVYLTQDGPERRGIRVAEHDELVAR